MAAPSPKTDRLRQMREDNFAKQEAKVAISKPQRIAEARQAVEAVSQACVTGRGVTHKAAKSNAERQAKWREGNPELSKKLTLDRMKKSRAAR